MLSGEEWVKEYPTSKSIDDLADTFRAKAQSFVDSLLKAGAAVSIGDTLRPPKRARLMYSAYQIAHGEPVPLNPSEVPEIPGVDIQWEHRDANGLPDLAASKAGALEMVDGYHIVHEPALHPRHIEGLAIDMTISWQGDLVLMDGKGAKRTIASEKRNGADNPELHLVGRSFGVIKLLGDAPH
jgi:hypothetical protein